MTIHSHPGETDATSQPGCAQRYVTVHSGARDGYQLALALADAGILDTLITDLYWPFDRQWARILTAIIPASLHHALRCRSNAALPSSKVQCRALTGMLTLLLDKLPRIPFALRRSMARRSDTILGRSAGELATRHGVGLISYSYYAHAAFARFSSPGILFQLHPHPLSMRRILSEELAEHPDCADSLLQEWELSVPEDDFQRLVDETTLPDHILCASSFTRRTLVEHGTPVDRVTVIPYGVDTTRFCPNTEAIKPFTGKLKLLFVGRINQRKGIKYLLEALRRVDTDQVELTVCGRVVDSLDLFRPFGKQVVIRPSVSERELIDAYQSADLFVFPSVAEGFGQVLLESLACGLPILSTTHTAAPDLIEDGVEGFIVEPRDPTQIAERIVWALTHPVELAAMRVAARRRAKFYTWQCFRTETVAAIRAYEGRRMSSHVREGEAIHV